MSKSSIFWRLPPERQTHWTDRGETREPRLWLWSLLASLIVIVFQIVNHVTSSSDYVGIDPDDAMRLVEVRDFLAGQGWFDLHQYRLGLDGGTLMHWSRLIDLPIAILIRLASLVTSGQAAEALALAIWPLGLIIPLMAAQGLAGFRLAGTRGLVASLVLTGVIVMEMIRFRIGAIDHHNAQLVLVATIAACLLDPAMRASSFALAGVAAALALGIGAETTPFVAVSAMAVAILWAWRGIEARSASLAFAAAIGLSTLALFLATVPVSRMTAVTCDTLSFGTLALTVAGACLLFLGCLTFSASSLIKRAAALAVTGLIVGMMALSLMPHCLSNPLGDLDPLLVSVWLGKVSEARSLGQVLAKDGAFAGSFYALGILGLATCIFRVLNGDRVQAHAMLAGLIGISLLVTFLQVRGMVFSNLLGALPLAALIVDMQAVYRKRAGEPLVALGFVVVTLMSIPASWSFAGAMIRMAEDEIRPDPARLADNELAAKPACSRPDYLQKLNSLPEGRIMAPSNIGSALLRQTFHQVLSAPYHRNQAGMLAELRAGMTSPAEAEPIIRAAGVSIVVFCRWDPLVRAIAKSHPDGLYAELARGHMPDYLALQVPLSNPNMATFTLKPASAVALNP